MLLLRNPNLYYGVGRRRRVARPRVLRRRRGGSFFGSIGDALSKAHDSYDLTN